MYQQNETIRKMINYENVTKENIQDNPNWPQIPGQKFLSFEPGKTNALLNQMKKKMMMIILLLIKLIYMLRIQMM